MAQSLAVVNVLCANPFHLALFPGLVVPTTPQLFLNWGYSVVGKWQFVLGEALSSLLKPVVFCSLPTLVIEATPKKIFTLSTYSTL